MWIIQIILCYRQRRWHTGTFWEHLTLCLMLAWLPMGVVSCWLMLQILVLVHQPLVHHLLVHTQTKKDSLAIMRWVSPPGLDHILVVVKHITLSNVSSSHPSSRIFFFLEDLFCLSRNSLVFTIIWELVEIKPEATLLPIQGIFNLPLHIDMVWKQLAFDDAVSYAQQWKIQIGRVDGMGNRNADLQIRSPT